MGGSSPAAVYDHAGARFILCVNPASGGHAGDQLADLFESRLNSDVAVVRLGTSTAQRTASLAALTDTLRSWSRDRSVRTTRLIIAGGDGTACWALTTLEAIWAPLSPPNLQLPPVALFPLGTGNELSRCLGWGSTSSTDAEAADQFLEDAVSGTVESLDRWVIEGWDDGAQGTVTRPNFVRAMLCFFSIGFDADISDQFSKWREARPNLFSSTFVNKIGYAYLGVRALVAPSPTVAGLLLLEVDGVAIELPDTLRTIQILNCHSSSDGVDFFSCGQPSVPGELQVYSPPSSDDGLLEVVGTEGVGHLLSTRLGFRHSHRLAQGKEIKITVISPWSSLVAQADGESWMPTGMIRVTAAGAVDVVIGPSGRFPTNRSV